MKQRSSMLESSTRHENLFLHNGGSQILLLNPQHMLLSHISMMDAHWAVLDVGVKAVGNF